jgi:outer membrane protein TolC
MDTASTLPVAANRMEDATMIRVWCVTVVMLAYATAASAQTSSRTLSLDEAIAIAVEQNRTLANAALAAEDADHDVATAKTRLRPSFKVETQASQLLTPVDITFSRGAFGDFPATGPVPSTDTTLTTPRKLTTVINASVSQPLTQLHEIGLRIRMAEAGRDVEREQARAMRVAVVGDVKRLYYSILQTYSARGAARAQATQLMELERVVTNRVEQRVALRGSAIEVQARVAQSRLTLLTLDDTIESQKEQLNRLLGRDVRTAFELAGVPEPTSAELNADEAVARALGSRPDVKQAQAKLRQAELSRRLAKADYIPDVSVAASYWSPMSIEGAPKNIASVGIQLQWEPFDWGRKSHAVASAVIATRQARNGLDDAEQQVIVDVNSGFRRLAEARLRLEATNLAQDAARENTRVKLAQFNTDAALAADVLQSHTAFADATNQYQQALMSYFTARADFDRALGEDVTK